MALQKDIPKELIVLIRPVTGGADAIGRFRENPEGFDLVINNISMPVLTGAL